MEAIKKLESIAFRLTNTWNWKQFIEYIWKKYINKEPLEDIFSGDATEVTDYDTRDIEYAKSELAYLPYNTKSEMELIDQSLEYRIRNWCVPINIMVAHHNNHPGVQISYTMMHEFINHCENKGLWREDYGASVPRIANEYRRWWNEKNPDNKIWYIRTLYTSDRTAEAIKKGYQIVWSRNTMKAYSQDRFDNRKIDDGNYKDKTITGGHCQTFMFWKNLEQKRMFVLEKNWKKEIFTKPLNEAIHCVNSYPVRYKEFNIYEHTRLSDHIKNGIWNSWVYIFYPITSKPEVDAEIKDWQEAQELGIWNGENPDMYVTRKDCARMCMRAVRLNKKK